MLESAIPPNLLRERKCPVSTPPNYQPPFPAYCARFSPETNDLVLAIIGVQIPTKAAFDPKSLATIKKFVTDAPVDIRASSWEVASVTDKHGAYNIAIFAYWPKTETQKKWGSESGFNTWWQSSDREHDGHGWFKEVFRPSIDRFETVFSNSEHPEGAANMQDKISGEIEQHAYWGSMRDRMAAAQDDELSGERLEQSKNSAATKRVRVPGKKNLCIIRSGQDWSDTLPEERALYLNTMHPVLVKGMTFLRDEGREIGCYANNLWDVVDPVSYEADKERTFGLGFFDDMKSLEYWSKSHQTHINIFGGFLMYAKKLNNVLSLRLFHEVYVLEEGQQEFEYIGCHKDTGMLVA
ncbi:heme-containing dehydratase protein [Paraphoma chrysanthemicola]|uniref:Heme-containing dehydratase protein n=1 Tax=Paraphoma chrysanthemicola TaxID=798071 RepID=A0A8K0QV86_9PLEO|nr:heme-containing dehydratase protein [Paraphoma chrysanthemicola]